MTHTFTELGLYNISVTATYTDANGENQTMTVKRELLIGECESAEAVEVVADVNSFGSQTPTDLGPVWNYIRPSDTNTANIVELIRLSDSSLVYKYKRNSASKFLDIDIQNADECFFDDQPLAATLEIACPDDVSDCGGTSYTMREDVTPLSSCTGNAFDMATLDTNQTACTYDVFLLAARQTNKERIQQAFIKVCLAGNEYCYFGPQSAFDGTGISSDICSSTPITDPSPASTN